MPTRTGRGISNITGRLVLAAALALALAGCGEREAERVDPAAHDAFFLWAGVPAPDYLRDAQLVYLLAGEIRAGDPRYVRLRAVPRGAPAEIWLTVRAERIDWDDAAYEAVLGDLERWQAAGNRLGGLQVDFDARTRGLGNYARFLADLRERLPRRYGLSITGLMDWSAGGDPGPLARLAGTVDEIVVQTYQGRETIPGYEAWLASLERLGMPYRIAIVEGGEWRAPAGLEKDPHFRGYVVFLLPPRRRAP
ncbi:MAG TPA: DUF3142 domain-containing protein [Alteraurantiacibacter sp.]